MKIGWLLFLLLILTKPMQNASLNEIRTLYAMAPNNRIASEKLSTLCLSIDSIASPVLVCYKGASTMIEAKYQINPLNKLAKFNEGKLLIEKAFKREPNNIEIRFIRFSIQTNIPTFLGYHSDIEEDKKNLINNMSLIADTLLKTNINNCLSKSKYCTIEELKKLKDSD